MRQPRRAEAGPVAGLIGIWAITLVGAPLFTWGFIDSLEGPDKLGIGWLIALAGIVVLIIGNAVTQTVLRLRQLRTKDN